MYTNCLKYYKKRSNYYYKKQSSKLIYDAIDSLGLKFIRVENNQGGLFINKYN